MLPIHSTYADEPPPPPKDDHKYTKNDDEADAGTPAPLLTNAPPQKVTTFNTNNQSPEFFDVKFYPYDPVGSAPLFAAVSKKHVVICLLLQDNATDPCEMVGMIRDADEDAVNCCCCWAKEAGTDHALLCVAGRDAKVKVYKVRDGSLYTTLVGHGGEINDLVTSPADPRLVASASDDTTVRLWSLEPVHARQPCVGLLGGEGHSWSLLTAAFHDTGRYLLTAGHDQVVNLWTLPDLPKHHVDTPVVVHYPHFSTSEVHSGLVDCVAFCGDLVLSRACHEDKIVLWRIEGFDSNDPPPPPSAAPAAYDQSRTTRSAFAPPAANLPAAWLRLLQFETKNCGVQFFLRFRLHHNPGQHPILCFCNAKNEIMMWDLARLSAYDAFTNSLRGLDRDAAAAKIAARPAWLAPAHHNAKKAAPREEEAQVAAAAAVGKPVHYPDPLGIEELLLQSCTRETVELWQSKYDASNPHKMIRPHKTDGLQGPVFVGRQVAWTPDGSWCVVVGSRNLAVIFQRWGKGARNSTSRQNSHVGEAAPAAAKKSTSRQNSHVVR